MDLHTVKVEPTDFVEVEDSEAETESSPLSEVSESSCEHLKQTGFQICTDDFSGQFNFTFFIDPSESSKRHWVYSVALNKVYIDMNRVLPLQFQWKFDEIESLGVKQLRIRALPIFATPEFQQLSMKRCPVHVLQDKLSNGKKREHIIWCEQADAVYEEDPKSQRYSVVAAVNSYPPSSYKTYNVLYKFMCKTSCSMSLSRRPIYVIFTLETMHGQVLGRKKLGVRVCSCPRRDMLKEEEIQKKKMMGVRIDKRMIQVTGSDVPTKVPKIINDIDKNKVYEIPVLPVLGKRLYLSTLELLHGHFLGNAVREDRLIDYHPLISMVADLISQVKSENNNHDNDADSENQPTQTN